MSTNGPKSNGTSGTNGGEVRVGAESAEDQSEAATCPHKRKVKKSMGEFSSTDPNQWDSATCPS
ncbi:hypothetical protein KI387_043861 [Taxus chinensis]|uniref:Uncharacterized protein n=1 Tax=Taxus chinensis TaxID=29808 RepID=A0AA38CWG5_TAXCH|nr:hypothetical protein KI387_043861 [Taxus chinensis]